MHYCFQIESPGRLLRRLGLFLARNLPGWAPAPATPGVRLIRNIPPYSRVGLATPDFQLHITGQRDPAARRGRRGHA
jgi:hypothetical protein